MENGAITFLMLDAWRGAHAAHVIVSFGWFKLGWFVFYLFS